MVALIKTNGDGDGDLFGPLVRDRVVELIAEDVAEAVRRWQPGAVILEGSTPYAHFLAGVAKEVWEELQKT